MTLTKKSILACLLCFSYTSPVLLTSCVTVNVNFPESAVQKATDDYVRNLYRSKERGRTSPLPSAVPGETSSNHPLPPSKAMASTGWSIISSAWADDEDVFKVESPKALAIREKLRDRLPEILAQKREGVLGESNEGMLILKDKTKLKPLLMKKVEKLVDDENSDRKDLYNEVTKLNGLPSSRTKNVQKSFSRSFQSESPSGTWVENADSAWVQKQ